jgi:polyhydroxyalkanoate synthesis regulator phasin
MNLGTAILIFFAMAFGVGVIAIIAEHFQKIAQIKADAQKRASGEMANVIEALRREVAQLRDTTTNYDLSFDSALQRLESRVERLEGRVSANEQVSACSQPVAGR